MRHEKYRKLCHSIEKFSTWIFPITIYVTPCTNVPFLFSSYFSYLTTDMGRDAFTLPFMMW